MGMSALIIFIIYLFNNAMKRILMEGCPYTQQGNICPGFTTINQQTYLSLSIAGILILISLFLVFSKPNEIVVVKKIKEKNQERKIDLSNFNLKKEEKDILSLIQENKAIFQADIIDKTGFGKAKITRILDRLEGSGLVERKRRGMTNIVVLKN